MVQRRKQTRVSITMKHEENLREAQNTDKAFGGSSGAQNATKAHKRQRSTEGPKAIDIHRNTFERPSITHRNLSTEKKTRPENGKPTEKCLPITLNLYTHSFGTS